MGFDEDFYLWWAARDGRIEEVDQYINQGADLHWKDYEGM